MVPRFLNMPPSYARQASTDDSGRYPPYAIGSGSPGGRGISKTLSVIDTSM
jgi:hypothetical protein